jgi:hypothetical protein
MWKMWNLASQARHQSVARKRLFASRNVVGRIQVEMFRKEAENRHEFHQLTRIPKVSSQTKDFCYGGTRIWIKLIEFPRSSDYAVRPQSQRFHGANFLTSGLGLDRSARSESASCSGAGVRRNSLESLFTQANKPRRMEVV